MSSAASIDERWQFRVLYRSFLVRVIDLELLSASGDVRNLLAQLASLLAAYSFVLAILTVSHFAQSSAGHSKLGAGAWGLEEFLISTTITVAGLFAVLAWDAVLPHRRDSFVLDPLPLRTRTVFGSKGAAVATALGISVIAVNIFTGLSIPFLVLPGAQGLPVLCGASWRTGRRWLRRARSYSFPFLLCRVWPLHFSVIDCSSASPACCSCWRFLSFWRSSFLTPPLATPSGLSSPANRHLLASLPSFWFLGLFHQLNGTGYDAFAPLAARAVWSLAAVCLFTSITIAGTYRRTIRRIIEQPDIAPGDSRGILSKVVSAITLRMLADPIDRAILLFSARTLARSRQHRLLLAFYVGTAFAISLAYAKSLLYGTSDQHWDQPDIPLLITGLVTLFFAIIGSRAVFALPFVLSANWIFRITSVRSPASYFTAVRKALFTSPAVPVLLPRPFCYLSIWPGRPALQHLLVLVLLAVLLVQVSLRKFRKIPFACSYLPGKSNLRLKLGIAGFLFLLAVETGASVELWSMEKPARYATVLAILIAAVLWETPTNRCICRLAIQPRAIRGRSSGGNLRARSSTRFGLRE